MKLSCAQEHLGRGLALVGRGVAATNRSTLPVTSNVLLATDEGRLRLSATDLDIGITAWIPAMVEEEGSTTVPARLMSEFISSLPNERVDMSVAPDGFVTRVRCVRYSANIQGINPEEFPLIPTVTEKAAARIPAGRLKNMIAQVAFCAAAEDTRPILTGVLTAFSGTRLTMAASDGYRLSVRSVDLTDVAQEGDFSVIVPSRILNDLGRILPDDDSPVDMTITPNRSQILFHMEGLNITSRLLEGTYVNYRQIIPQKHSTTAVLATADLAKAARIASFFARDSSNVVRLVLEPTGASSSGSLTVSATTADVGDNQSVIDAVVDGPGVQVLFRAKYILDVLSIVESSQVVLELNGPTAPAVIRPVPDSDFLHVMMPMSTPR